MGTIETGTARGWPFSGSFRDGLLRGPQASGPGTFAGYVRIIGRAFRVLQGVIDFQRSSLDTAERAERIRERMDGAAPNTRRPPMLYSPPRQPRLANHPPADR